MRRGCRRCTALSHVPAEEWNKAQATLRSEWRLFALGPREPDLESRQPAMYGDWVT